MKNSFLLSLALIFTNGIFAQELKLSQKSKSSYELEQSNFISSKSTQTYNNSSAKPAREFFRKETMKKGAFKTGTAYGTSTPFITGAELLLFNSEVINSTVPLLKSTQTPFIAMDIEYNVTDDIAVGVFGGYTTSDSSNRGSDGVNQKIDTNGIVMGGHVTLYRPLTSWLYMPMYLEYVYEKGKLEATDGLEVEKYEYVRNRPSLGFGVTLVFAEYIQVDLRGIDIAYSQVQFVQTQRVDTDSDGTQRIDQSIKNNVIELATNPRLRIMFNVFNFAGGSNR